MATGIYVLAAVTMVLTLFASAWFVAKVQDRLNSELREIAPSIKKSGGVLLILVGMYLIALSAFSPFFNTVYPV